MILKHSLKHGGNIRASKTSENVLSIQCFSAYDLWLQKDRGTVSAYAGLYGQLLRAPGG